MSVVNAIWGVSKAKVLVGVLRLDNLLVEIENYVVENASLYVCKVRCIQNASLNYEP